MKQLPVWLDGALHFLLGDWKLFAATFVLLGGCNSDRVTLDELREAASTIQVDSADLEASIDALNRDGGRPALEKSTIKLGFIKLTDCAPLVIAKEKGFFAAEGLNVELEAQSNWKVLLDRVIDGQLDGAHMLAPQPIAATIGYGTQADMITAYSLDYNGNAITVSNAIWEAMQEQDPGLQAERPPHPIRADALKPVVQQYRQSGREFNMGMVFPVSTHNYELRYWLAAAGIHPGFYDSQNVAGTIDAEVVLSVTPPPQMPSTLEAGTILGYCVGEPWNQVAVAKGIGVPVVTNSEIWKNNPEKVFGVTARWHEQHPQTHVAIIKALIRAGKWLDEQDGQGEYVNRQEAVKILSQPQYVGADEEVIARSMTGSFVFQPTDVQPAKDFNVFFRDFASYPHYSDCIWFLTQMRRWGQIDEPKPPSWYAEVAKRVYRPDIYRQAAAMLIAEGHLSPSELPPEDYDGYRPPSNEFIDGMTYDGRDPVGYLNSFTIGIKEELAGEPVAVQQQQ
ncbi:MAG: nitrate ABC transporter substrate-binding protein [Pirellulaceae bacterium]|nr:MAG: nitrate ABC transporter substrate-binding protein [Pirellulaceae bacterium]